MEKRVLVPDIGDITDVEVIEILVKPGDGIEVDQSLITLESDKATMEVPAPFAGTVQSLQVAIGDKLSEGSPILILDYSESSATESASPDLPETAAADAASPVVEQTQTLAPADAGAPEQEGEAAATPELEDPGDPAPSMDVQEPPAGDSNRANVHASPSVRRYARELGADLSAVSGSGRKGRILRDDVTAFVKKSLSRPAGVVATGVSAPVVDFSRFGEIERRPLTRIQRLSASHLHQSWVSIPHVTQHGHADITDLEAFRKELNKEYAAEDIRLTLLPFLMKAAVASLREFAGFNASLDSDGESLILKNYFHIGIAVDTPDGLVVPVVRDVDQKGLRELASELAELSARARNRKLMPADLQGGSFSISSLGGIGGTAFTPIINQPEVAILGVSRSELKPVCVDVDSQPQVRLMLPLSLSYDHRVIDGAAAARFVVHLGNMLSDLRRLLV